MRQRVIYLIILLATGFSSCNHYDKLKRDLNDYYKPQLGYIHDRARTNCIIKDTVTIYFNGHGLPKEALVSKTGYFIVPLIIFNFDRAKMVVTLGQNIIKDNYVDFFTTSFKKESMRSGCYVTNTPGGDSSLVLNIDMQVPPLVNARVNSTGYLAVGRFAAAWGKSYRVFDAECKLGFEATLYRGGRVLMNKNYSIKRIQPGSILKIREYERQIPSLKNNMAEALSISTKILMDELVNDINAVLNKN